MVDNMGDEIISPKKEDLESHLSPYKQVVSPEGFEPSTLGLKGRCSTGLSYGPT